MRPYSHVTKTILLDKGAPELKRAEIRKYFHDTFTIDEMLYETINCDEAFYLRADPLRHPLIFYLGHTAVFYINKLMVAKLISQRLNPKYESMFAIGVDEMSWDDLNMAHYEWPSVAEVKAYREQVRGLVDNLIINLPLEMPITWDNPWWAIIMGIEHQRIHLETSSVLIRQLPIDKVRQLEMWAICKESGEAPQNQLLPVSGQTIVLGKKWDAALYGWDNEYGTYQSEVKDFSASKYLCSNREFYDFILAGGYQSEEYWTPEGWAWKCFQQAEHPRFWQRHADQQFFLRTMASIIPMPWNWPVEVNYLEAKAWCNWKARTSGLPIRLPSEPEWYALRDLYIGTDQPFWDKAPGNINLEYYASCCPVDRFGCGDFYDLIGNVWQWTESPIFGYAGFKVHPYYDDFSTPTFDNQHNLIKGGSWISTGNEAIRDSRYAFRRHFYQHAGFRYISSDAPIEVPEELYESEADVISWCETDWGSSPLEAPSYYDRLLSMINAQLGNAQIHRAMHIGCKTGRLTFMLASIFEEVIGLDTTARLIKAATRMKEQERLRYIHPIEGEVFEYREHCLSEYGLEGLSSRVSFMQLDASNLNPKYRDFDFVLAEGVISGTLNPRAFIAEIPHRLNPSGILVIADSYNWQDEITPPDQRLGGYRQDGEPILSFRVLEELLGHSFSLLCPPQDLLHAIAIESRNYRLHKVHVSIWQKR